MVKKLQNMRPTLGLFFILSFLLTIKQGHSSQNKIWPCFFTTLTILLSECKSLSHTLPLAHSHAQHTLPRHLSGVFTHVPNVSLIMHKACNAIWFLFPGGMMQVFQMMCGLWYFFTHPQATQNVDEFVSSWEQIWINFALHHLLTNASSAVNGCRQNKSPNSW